MLKYRAELDGLRALSVVVVVLFHAGVPGFTGGFVGVDVFFALSGYLILSIVQGELETGKFTLRSFYERRVRRIAPALIFLLACTVPVACLLLPPPQLADFAESLIAAVFMVPNFYFWTNTGYFGAAAEMLPLLHTWSLGVGAQFYLAFSPVFMLVWIYRRSWIWPLTILAVLASLTLSEIFVQRSWSSGFYLPAFRIWELGLGMMAALYRRQHPLAEVRWWTDLLALVGVAMVIFAATQFSKATDFPGVNALVPVGGAVLVILFAGPNCWVVRLLALRPLVFIGRISFSIYLWCQPLFVFARIANGQELPPLVVAALLPLPFLFGYLSWRFVEQPFRESSVMPIRQVARTAASGVVMICILGIVLQADRGWQFRFDPKANQAFNSIAKSPFAAQCQASLRRPLAPQEVCRYFGKELTFAVLGDSHVTGLAYALAKQLEQKGQGLYQFSFSAGPPAFLLNDNVVHHRWSNDAVTFLSEAQAVETILLGYRHSAYINGQNLGHYPKQVRNVYFRTFGDDWEASRDAYWQSFEASVTQLIKAGKQVVLMLPIPELGRALEQVVYKGDWQGNDVVGVPRSYYMARNAAFLEKLHASPIMKRAIWVDPADFMCDAQNCYAVRDGISLYYDDDHLSFAGAALLAEAVLAAIAADGSQARP